MIFEIMFLSFSLRLFSTSFCNKRISIYFNLAFFFIQILKMVVMAMQTEKKYNEKSLVKINNLKTIIYRIFLFFLIEHHSGGNWLILDVFSVVNYKK